MIEIQQQLSCLNGSTAAYVEDLYDQYLIDPQSIPPEWKIFFDEHASGGSKVFHQAIQADILAQIEHKRHAQSVVIQSNEAQVKAWCDTVRSQGYHVAQVDPLGLHPPQQLESLTLQYHGLKDLTQIIDPQWSQASRPYSLQILQQRLETSYQGSIGSEVAHLQDPVKRRWLWSQLDTFADFKLTETEQTEVLHQLIRADGMEQFLARKFVAQKRFSLEGGDALIPLMEALLTEGAQHHGLKELAVCMAHRGRLNVMANVFGVSMQMIMDRFTGAVESDFETSGDVKYHLGCSASREVQGQTVHLSMAYNPSHLEFVNPVLQGMVKAKQIRDYPQDPTAICAVTLHGDAAVCAQGVVPETLNLSRTEAHGIAGGIHIIVNNQVGHSVSHVQDMTSCQRISDIFKAFDIPVLHVNGDDPEAVVFCARLAMAYRARFKEEIAIDLVCYRRLGHNEADEPSITQPLMYQVIRDRARLHEHYAQQLVTSKQWTQDQFHDACKTIQTQCAAGDSLITTCADSIGRTRAAVWKPFFNQSWQQSVQTAVTIEQLKTLAQQLQTHPEGFTYQRQIQRLMTQRDAMASGDTPMNWGFAELLAYASLIQEGHSVRLVGQDVRRGTFSHRQAVLHDYQTGESYALMTPIEAQSDAQFNVYDSTLSEAGVLGAEYGYASVDPNTLVLWEAQFGDFSNSAQVLIDQFLSAAWQKWQRLCHLVLLLPHGYEGQGPEHSSARLERYLQLCAQHNMQVCVPTTPAQIFHLLRRQIHRPFRQPLVIMSPKSLLRHPEAISTFENLSEGEFQCVLDDQGIKSHEPIKRVVLCSGKIYYELSARRAAESMTDVALIRIEQLYPFPYESVQAVLSQYAQATEIIWCQEEPQNQGAWYSRRHCFEICMQSHQTLQYAGREPFAAPAAGSPKLHQKRQAAVIDQALGLADIQPVQYGSVQYD